MSGEFKRFQKRSLETNVYVGKARWIFIELVDIYGNHESAARHSGISVTTLKRICSARPEHRVSKDVVRKGLIALYSGRRYRKRVRSLYVPEVRQKVA